jgi:hypothetical protein
MLWPLVVATDAALVNVHVVPFAVPPHAVLEATIGLQKLLDVVVCCAGVV